MKVHFVSMVFLQRPHLQKTNAVVHIAPRR